MRALTAVSLVTATVLAAGCWVVGAPAAEKGGFAAQDKLERVTALADTKEGGPARPSAPSPIWAIAALGLVVALAYLAAVALRSSAGSRAWPRRKVVTVLESRLIAPDRWLHLIDTADSLLLVGSTSHSMALLHRITDDSAAALLRERAGAESDAFSSLLAAARRGLMGRDAGGPRAWAEALKVRVSALSGRGRH